MYNMHNAVHYYIGNDMYNIIITRSLFHMQVAGVVGRAELLSSLFFLLALLTYHKLQDSDKWKQLIGTLLLCLCSFLSKEQGIMAAGVCLTYEIFIMNKVCARIDSYNARPIECKYLKS